MSPPIANTSGIRAISPYLNLWDVYVSICQYLIYTYLGSFHPLFSTLLTPLKCAQNPCNIGCPTYYLIPARLADEDDIAAPFLSLPASNLRSAKRTEGLVIGLTTSGIALFLVALWAIMWRGVIRNALVDVLERYRERRRFGSSDDDEESEMGSEDVDSGKFISL